MANSGHGSPLQQLFHIADECLSYWHAGAVLRPQISDSGLPWRHLPGRLFTVERLHTGISDQQCQPNNRKAERHRGCSVELPAGRLSTDSLSGELSELECQDGSVIRVLRYEHRVDPAE